MKGVNLPTVEFVSPGFIPGIFCFPSVDVVLLIQPVLIYCLLRGLSHWMENTVIVHRSVTLSANVVGGGRPVEWW